MWEKVDKKMAELFVVSLLIAVAGIYASIWYTWMTFHGVFNPIYKLVSLIFDFVLSKKVLFPENLAEYQAMLDAPAEKFAIPFLSFYVGLLLLVIGFLTVICCLRIAREASQYLQHTYIKARFGRDYYSLFLFNERLKEKAQDNKTEQEKQLEDLVKVQREHYEKWKKYHKSELTFKEWKERVLNESVDDRG